jgi:hypothetical protein
VAVEYSQWLPIGPAGRRPDGKGAPSCSRKNGQHRRYSCDADQIKKVIRRMRITPRPAAFPGVVSHNPPAK